MSRESQVVAGAVDDHDFSRSAIRRAHLVSGTPQGTSHLGWHRAERLAIDRQGDEPVVVVGESGAATVASFPGAALAAGPGSVVGGAKRAEIRSGSERGETCSAIAAHFRRATSTISEGSGEERRSGSPPGLRGQTGALVGVRRRPKVAGVGGQSETAGNTAGVARRPLSPEQIAKQLREQHP